MRSHHFLHSFRRFFGVVFCSIIRLYETFDSSSRRVKTFQKNLTSVQHSPEPCGFGASVCCGCSKRCSTKMFSRILSSKTKKKNNDASPASPSNASINSRRSPPQDRDQAQVEGPRAIFFTKSASDRAARPKTPTPPLSPPGESRGGIFVEDPRLASVPKQAFFKKGSEPNVLLAQSKNAHLDKMRKSNSQPTLNIRRSTDLRTSANRNKKKEQDMIGFLDRAFANAATVALEESIYGDHEESSDAGSSPPTSTSLLSGKTLGASLDNLKSS